MNEALDDPGARDVIRPQPPGAPSPARAKGGRVAGMVVAALPTVVFVAVNALSGLHFALVAAGATALAALGHRIARRRPLREAVIGLAIVAACALAAALTGQARGFFLLPALVPFAVLAVCLVSLIIRRPLTGVILNRVTGGPTRWYGHPRLMRVHTVATLVCMAVNVVNATLQAVFYLGDNTVVLAAAHIATGPVFAAVVAVTVVCARRVMPPGVAA